MILPTLYVKYILTKKKLLKYTLNKRGFISSYKHHRLFPRLLVRLQDLTVSPYCWRCYLCPRPWENQPGAWLEDSHLPNIICGARRYFACYWKITIFIHKPCNLHQWPGCKIPWAIIVAQRVKQLKKFQLELRPIQWDGTHNWQECCELET